MTSPDHEAAIETEFVASLYQTCAEDLRLFLTGILRDRELAGEALQSVFHKALEQGPSESGNLRGWLFRVAYHEAMLIRREQQRERRVLGEAVSVKAVGAAEQSGADAAVLREETVERVRQAIRGLPDNQQDVVRKRIYEDKTFAVIAGELGLPLGTVLTRMRLATERLQQTLRQN